MNDEPIQQAGVNLVRLEDATLENLDDAFAEIDELTERWNNRLTVNKLAFAERYEKGDLGVGVEVFFKKDRAKKLVAVFEREDLVQFPCRRFARPYGHSGRSCTDWDDGSVFINRVQLVQNPEGVPFPSTVRLKSSDQTFDFRSCTLEEPLGTITGKACFIGSYWEIGVLKSAVRGMPIENDETCSEAVEGRSCIVNYVADVSAPAVGDWFDDLNSVNFDRRFRVFIDNDAIRLALTEVGNFEIEICKVFLGPVDLDPTALERIGGHWHGP